ncbi:MAG: hypothetical protein UR28_C0048G0001 [Candidatus Peregrinibacteria bacterium GW2011_GWF2_33_10]|nr:MAG: hypothetical protein UR28_C0048G0001 [Candidatus Peregrinibacteria bacterium GW2011_GWF2_33_10]
MIINNKNKFYKIILKIAGFLRLKGLIIRLLAITLFSILFLLKKYRKIVFCPIVHHRIGHLAMNTDLFLRRLKNGYFPSKNIYIGVSNKFPANRQLMKMFKRYWHIIENDILRDVISIYPIRGSEFYYELPFDDNEYFEFNNIKPVLYFTQEEEKIGKKLLLNMGIGEKDWFVCFFARDKKYLTKDINNLYNKDWSCHDYRNSDINNYLKAAEYIVNKGGFALRMGSIVEKPLPKERHAKIIDYALDFRSDFMDVYLIAHCKYILSTNCGITNVAQLFNVPEAWANVAPIRFSPFLSSSRFILKKLWLKREPNWMLKMTDLSLLPVLIRRELPMPANGWRG